jgi:hypothetical protein
MRLRILLHRSAATAILALAACTGSAPGSGVVDVDAQLPEPVRPAASASPRTPALTGLTLAVTSGATELYVIDVDRVQVTSQGIAGGAAADPAATAETVRGVLRGLRFWAEDGGLIVEGQAPFAGRARAQTRGGVLRFSRTGSTEGGAEGTLTAEVRGAEIVGRVAHRSAADGTRMHGAFFRAPLRRVDPHDWPPRAPQTLSAERLADGGVLLRWTVPANSPPDAEYVVYRTADPSRPAVQAGLTRKTLYAAPAPADRAVSWYVVTRSASGATSSPSPSATLP